MSHQKVTRDVLDLKSRPINVADTPGIEIIGDCGANFSIDGVPIGLVQQCDARFADLDITGDLDVLTGTLTVGGTASITGQLNMNNSRIINLGDAVAATDALNMQSGDGRYINVSGDTMAGALDMGGFKITSLGAPTPGSTDAATAAYVDNAVANAPGGFDSGQTMQDVTGLRSHNTTYTNTTGVMMWVTVAVNISSSGQLRLEVDGIGVTESDFDTLATNDWIWHACMVPPGSTYRLQLLTGTINSQRWTEFRL